MKPSVSIRPARADEAALVLELWKQSDATPSITDTIEEVTNLCAESTATLFVALEADRIVGSVIAGWDGWRGSIYRLAVLQQYRRTGIARALVQAACDTLAAKGARVIDALVEHAHADALGFWDSLGELGFARDPRMSRYLRLSPGKPRS